MFVLAILGGDVEVRAAHGLEADVSGERARRTVTGIVSAIRDADRAALWLVLHDDVDDARDGIRTILSGRAFGEHFNVVDRVDWDEVEVDARTALVGATQDGEARGGVTALAVDQHQRVVRGKATQFCLQRLVRHVAAEGLRRERRHHVRQRAHEVRPAGGLQLTRIEHLHGRGAGVGVEPSGAGAGDDDGLRFRLFRRRGGISRGVLRVQHHRRAGEWRQQRRFDQPAFGAFAPLTIDAHEKISLVAKFYSSSDDADRPIAHE